ncbi:MAG: MoaD/ThiS family protein [Brachybacterium tyrofermentans]
MVDRSSILVNAVACTDRDQELRDGDRLDVLPPFAGG